MKINEFIVAYAVRRLAYHHYATAKTDTYEKAEIIARTILWDDDDARVWFQVDGEWYCIWDRDVDTGCFIISTEIDRRTAYLSNYY